MVDYGKRCRFVLHHPMSLSDFLAALFRSKRILSLRSRREALIGFLRRKEANEAEMAGDRPLEVIKEAVEADDLILR